MTERRAANVLTAYEMLLEELDAEIDYLNKAGGHAFAKGDHAQAQAALATVKELISLRSDLRAWGSRLRTLAGATTPAASNQAREGEPTRAGRYAARRRSSPSRTIRQRGLRTPEEAYRIPILRVLVEMGGRGQTSTVLDRVYPLVKDRLTDHDHAPLNSRSNTPRWRNSAAWCRKKLCDEGLLRTDSPTGVWEISEKGRQWLAAQDRQAQT